MWRWRSAGCRAGGGTEAVVRKSDVIIGAGTWIKELYGRISMVAPTDVTVAIFGESGTGKELVARTIHAGHGSVALRCSRHCFP